MPWPLVCLLIVGGVLLLMLTGMPVAFAFVGICVIGAFLFWGGFTGIEELSISIFSSISNFSFIALPLFILMGTIIFESGIGTLMVDTLNNITGRLPGRLSVVAITTGTLLATLTGASTATVTILAKSLMPQMLEYKYDKKMIFGPILAAGQLAPMIPPSGMAIFLAAVAGISVGKLLIASIIPGLLMAFLFIAYIVIVCLLKPSLAPSYVALPLPFNKKLKAAAFNILPVGIVIFAVIGVMFVGIATPSEAAGSGVVACYVLALIHKKLNWQTIKKSAISALEVSVMILMIIAVATAFSKLLFFTGAIKAMVNLVANLAVPSIIIVIGSQLVGLFLGMFLGPFSIIMVTIPIYIPILVALGYDPVWFAVMLMINVETALLTPPIGMNVFVMQSFAPGGTTTWEVFSSTLPFVYICAITIFLVMFFPQIVMWLPNLMH